MGILVSLTGHEMRLSDIRGQGDESVGEIEERQWKFSMLLKEGEGEY